MSWHQDSTALFITVCDGVGSLEMSQDAAEWVTLRMAEIVRRDESGALDWPAAFATLSAELAELAAVRGPMATTVVSACVTPVDDRFRAEIAWVGDSAAYLLGPAGWEVAGGSVKTVPMALRW